METERNAEGMITESEKLVDAIRPILTGKNPEVVGATIGQLLAIYIASNHPDMRADTRAMLLDMVDGLVPVIIEELIEAGNCGPDWRSKREGMQ